ncbi:MAG: sugar ABC transporter substrate-binding protein [Thermomicrobiales bacterium]|nr:sugar ABC transporter substrate-binding protein [Thermomicrobiales bacterium]MCO5228210.1 sugar ABC transporter substrate-binding protein [Thermomicrobiales bacterium]
MVSHKFDRRTLMQASAAGAAAAMFAKSGFAQDEVTFEPYDGEEVTISYGIWDSAQQAGVEEQIAAFKAVQPNITVEIQLTPWSDYWTKLQTAVSGGEAFDVFWLNSANCPVYASAGALVPLDSIFGEGGLDPANYPEQILDLYSFEGHRYGSPREYDTIALFYNKDIFDAAGEAYPDDTWDWAKFREVAEKLTDEANGIYGVGLHLSGQENYSNFVLQNEGRYLNDALDACVVADEVVAGEALQWVTQFYLDGLTPGPDVQQSNPAPDSLFPGGVVGMLPGGSFRAKTYHDLIESGFNVGVAPLPQGKKRATVIHGLGNVVWSGSKNIGAAVEFAKFLGGEEAERLIGTTGIGLPAFKGLEYTWTDGLTELDAQVFVDASEYGVIPQDPIFGPAWQGTLGEEVQKGFAGETELDAIPQTVQDAVNATIADSQ